METKPLESANRGGDGAAIAREKGVSQAVALYEGVGSGVVHDAAAAPGFSGALR